MKEIKLSDDCSGIYKITNITNNKVYIGSSKSIYYRIRKHLSELKKGRHKNQYLQNSFNKYGEKSFRVEIVKKCSEDLLLKKEDFYIKKYKAEYNLQKDPMRQNKTPEMNLKISNSLKRGYKNGTILSTRDRSVSVYNSKGKLLDSFDTVKAAIAEYNLSTTRVYGVLKYGKIHTKGFQIFYNDSLPHNVQVLDLNIGNSGYLELKIKDRYIKPD